MINANLPLARLADHLKIPFDTLVAHINTPEVQAEINAYEALINLRARLIGESARPISLRKLLDVLESPAPRPSGRDIDADQRTLHRHAELIRRTATTIARESRALAPRHAPAPKHASDQLTQKGAPSASSGSSSGDSPTRSNNRARQEVPPVPAQHTCVVEPELVRDAPAPSESPSPSAPLPPSPSAPSLLTSPRPSASSAFNNSAPPLRDSDSSALSAVSSSRTDPATERSDATNTPGRAEAPARQSPTDALRAAAGSTHTLRGPSRRARDRPPHPAA